MSGVPAPSMTEYAGDAEVEIVPSGPIVGVRAAPPSKSVTNRLLLMAALATGTSRLHSILRSDDTAVMMAGLSALGADLSDLSSPDKVTLEIVGTAGRLTRPPGVVTAGLSGTTLRWLAAVALLVRGGVTLDGEAPLRKRPILPLLRALEALGAVVETDGGHPPLRITAHGLPGGPITVDAKESSQFATSLLLVAPYAEQDMSLAVVNLGAAGYVELTIEAMRRWGAGVVVEPGKSGRYLVTAGRHYLAREEVVEYDASAAGHLFALAMATGGSVTVPNAVATRQPDAGLEQVFGAMGADVTRHSQGGGVSVARTAGLKGIDVDVSRMPDQVPTLAVLGALAAGTTTLRNVSVARGHETDRVSSVARELTKLGANIDVLEGAEGSETMVIHGGASLHGGVVDTYDDHRMAMALSSIAAVVPGVRIRDPGCVRKTYPRYWDDAAALGLQLRRLGEPSGNDVDDQLARP
jgi:3-phosphoshikimate 1-carboxyvinyltransferase